MVDDRTAQQQCRSRLPFNAKIKLTTRCGWGKCRDPRQGFRLVYAQTRDTDAHYNNVVLHVVEQADTTVKKQNGDTPPQLVLPVPTSCGLHYKELLTADAYPPCLQNRARLAGVMVHSWLSAQSRAVGTANNCPFQNV